MAGAQRFGVREPTLPILFDITDLRRSLDFLSPTFETLSDMASWLCHTVDDAIDTPSLLENVPLVSRRPHLLTNRRRLVEMAKLTIMLDNGADEGEYGNALQAAVLDARSLKKLNIYLSNILALQLLKNNKYVPYRRQCHRY